jgi:putative membrane protein
MHSGGWVVMVLMMLVVWGLLVALIVWLARGSRGSDASPSTPRTGSPSPEDVLGQRYARGEIDDDEFERRRAALERAAAGL